MKKYQILFPFLVFALLVTLISINSCGQKSNNDSSHSGQSYSITIDTSARLHSTSGTSYIPFSNTDLLMTKDVQLMSSDGPTLCSSVVCFTPTSITGHYYGVGLLIQSTGNGMMAYFGNDSWSNITGTSTPYNFDMNAPIINSGTLNCCTSTGDLSNGNSYIESVAYLFGYLDTTFTISGITGPTHMNGEYTLRFVLASGAITDGVRGDVLVKEGADFKWVDTTTGTLCLSRPTSPVMMDTKVKDYVNPFGPSQGNQEIPVIYANVFDGASTNPIIITEAEIKTANRTYSFGFNPTHFIVFPTLIKSGQDINSIYNIKQLTSLVHLGGLPHSAQSMGIGNPAETQLTVTQ